MDSSISVLSDNILFGLRTKAHLGATVTRLGGTLEVPASYGNRHRPRGWLAIILCDCCPPHKPLNPLVERDIALGCVSPQYINQSSTGYL